MVKVVTDGRGQHDEQVDAVHLTPQVSQPDQPVHLSRQTENWKRPSAVSHQGPGEITALALSTDEASLEQRTHTHTHTDHLGDTEAVFEVVEGDVVVSSVDFKQELLQNFRLDVEGRYEIQVCVHELQQHHDLRVLPLPARKAKAG